MITVLILIQVDVHSSSNTVVVLGRYPGPAKTVSVASVPSSPVIGISVSDSCNTGTYSWGGIRRVSCA